MYTVIVVTPTCVYTYPCANEDDAATMYRQQVSKYSLDIATVLKVKVCDDGLAVLTAELIC